VAEWYGRQLDVGTEGLLEQRHKRLPHLEKLVALELDNIPNRRGEAGAYCRESGLKLDESA